MHEATLVQSRRILKESKNNQQQMSCHDTFTAGLQMLMM
jgi:hypothetical protein